MSSIKRKASWSTAQKPPRLRPGDKVAVPAPAGPVPEEGLLAGLEVLRSRYEVVYDEGVLARTGFLAGSDDRRAEELDRYLRDPDIRAIFPARGGYGVMRILDRIDVAALKREPKIVCGFSDVTALLSACEVAAQVRPIHGPMVVQLGRLPPEDAAWLFRMLEDPAPIGPVPATLSRLGARGGGTVEGRLVGGNLEMVTRLIGTPWEIDLGASIFFFEEIGERPYRIDRMLTQLKLASAFDGVRGVCIGDLTRCEAAPGEESTPPTEVIDERLETLDLPGVIGLPVGHGAHNLALPLGAECALDLARGTLTIEEGAVA
jgi:muramoyltetrapeptide carboxypeptidase